MKFVLLGAPKSTNHIYKYSCARGFVHGYMSSDGKALKETYQLQAQTQWQGDITGLPLKLTLTLFFGDKRRRDTDNCSKLPLDACNGIVWEDDVQIQELTIKKEYDGENPRVELDICF